MDRSRIVKMLARLSAAAAAAAKTQQPTRTMRATLPKKVADSQGRIMPDLSVLSRKIVRRRRRLYIFSLPAGSRE